jgi:hypothetical protein
MMTHILGEQDNLACCEPQQSPYESQAQLACCTVQYSQRLAQFDRKSAAPDQRLFAMSGDF